MTQDEDRQNRRGKSRTTQDEDRQNKGIHKTQKSKKMSNTDPTKNRGFTRELA